MGWCMNQNHLWGVLWMIASSVMFSLMALTVRWAGEVKGLGAWETAEFRFLICIAVVLGLCAWQRRPLRFVNRRWLVTRGVLGGASAFLFFYSIDHVGVAKATILNYTYPIWAGLFSPLLLEDRVRTGLWVAVAVAFGGLYLVVVPPSGVAAISWIDLVALSGGLISGWAVLSIKKALETDSSRAILFAQSFFGLLIVAVPAQAGGYSIPALGWALLAAVGLFAAAGQLLMTHAYKQVGAIEGSLLSMVTPVLNMVMGLLVFRELVTTRALVGCVIVLAGCAYAALPPLVPQALAEAQAGGRPT